MQMPKELAAHLYSELIKIRFAEESFVEPILQGIIRCPVHMCSGQEAIAVGISSTLGKQDYVFGNHRSHGHYLAKGGSLERMIMEIYCLSEGCCKGKGGSMHIIAPEVGMLGAAPIVSGTISLALGAALAAKNNHKKQIAVSYFGDGATGEGVLAESLNFASLKKLPIVFVCENNLYSTHMRIDEIRPTREISKLADAFNVKSYVIDGNDVLAVRECALEASLAAREGQGPAFIECKTYRQRGHVGPDDNIQGTHTDIRPLDEIERWLKRDPIKLFESYLISHKLLTASEMEVVQLKFKKEIEGIHQKAVALLNTSRNDLHKDLFYGQKT